MTNFFVSIQLSIFLIYFSYKLNIYFFHHIYYKNGIDEIINIQSVDSKAKPYQVKQVRILILKYKLIKQND